jgi:hypothetical protein
MDNYKIEQQKDSKKGPARRQKDRKNRKKQMEKKIKDVAEKGKPYKHYKKHFDWRNRWLGNWIKRHGRWVDRLLRDCKKHKAGFDKYQDKHQKKEKEKEEIEKLLKEEHDKFDTDCSVSNITTEGKTAKMLKYEQQKEKKECNDLFKKMKEHENKLWKLRRDLNHACK